MNKTLRLALCLSTLLLTACVTAPSTPEGAVDVSSLLDEINTAINRSIPNDPDFPALTSINLDLQVSVNASLGAAIPIQVVTVSPSIDRTKLHRVIIDFVPSAIREPSAVGAAPKEETQLAAAIRTLYQSVAHASPIYKLQRGSISLQCTLKMSGSAGVKLVPLNANAAASRSVVQTLTINFGRDPNRLVVPSTTGSGRATGGSSTRTGTTGSTGDATTTAP